MKRIDRVIWDFNGTLFDDVGIGIRAINTLLMRHGYRPIPSADAYRELFGFPIVEYYRRAGFDFERHPYDMLAHEWVAEYDRLEPEAMLRPDTHAAIAALSSAGVAQTLISATEQKMLERQLAGLGLITCFDATVGNDNIHAAGKSELILAWSRDHIDEHTVMIGDTEHDFVCAEAAGLDCLLVTGGHRPRRALEACGCPVLDSLTACAEYIIKHNASL